CDSCCAETARSSLPPNARRARVGRGFVAAKPGRAAMWWWRGVGKAKSLLTVPFLLVLLLLPSCFIIPIPIGMPVREDPAHYAARLEPPAQYNHPYNGPVVERVVPEAECARIVYRWVLICSPQLARCTVTAPAISCYRAMERRQFLIIVDTKLPIAMVGRQIIRARGEGFRTNSGNFATFAAIRRAEERVSCKENKGPSARKPGPSTVPMLNRRGERTHETHRPPKTARRFNPKSVQPAPLRARGIL